MVCGICAALPLALASVGAAGVSISGKEYRVRKKWILIGSAVSIVVFLFFMWFYKDCATCKA